MAMTTTNNWEAHVVAFLHVILQDEPALYLKPPQGYETYDKFGHPIKANSVFQDWTIPDWTIPDQLTQSSLLTI